MQALGMLSLEDELGLEYRKKTFGLQSCTRQGFLPLAFVVSQALTLTQQGLFDDV